MNGSTNEALTYSKAPLIESVFHNPIMKAIGSKIMNESPKICAIVTKKCVIPNLRCYKYLEPREQLAGIGGYKDNGYSLQTRHGVIRNQRLLRRYSSHQWIWKDYKLLHRP